MSNGAKNHTEQSLVRSRNLLIALLFFGTIINYIDRQVLSLLKPSIEAAYGWGDAEFAHFASMSQLAAATALIFVGYLLGRRLITQRTRYGHRSV